MIWGSFLHESGVSYKLPPPTLFSPLFDTESCPVPQDKSGIHHEFRLALNS